MIRLYFSKVINKNKHIFVLLVLALFLRIFNFSFPSFSAEEARIAFRGYSLSTSGVDELGRRFPYIFNSLSDYQLPLVSYISALGALFFGKSEFGARFPFLILGLVLVIMTYKVSTQLSPDRSFHFFSTIVMITSPVLIFLSKIPNEAIVLTTLLIWLFYLLNQKKINLILVFLAAFLLLLTSKLSWFIVAPFIIYTAFIFRNNLDFKKKLHLTLIGLIFSILSFTLFLQIPQSKRSLSENNFTLLSDITIINGINKIRGQGIESGWPKPLEQKLINKSYFLIVGLLHWLSNLQPTTFFSQFDKNWNLGFINMGAFPKITIIPAILGIVFLIKNKKSKLLLYPLIITFPTGLIYPKFSPELVVPALPFITFLIAFGFLNLKKFPLRMILLIMVIEVLVNIIFLSPQVKLTTESRPSWVRPLVDKAYQLSKTSKVLISDDVGVDLTSFILWYTYLNPKDAFLNIPYPYKFRQTNLGNIKVVGASDNFRNCGASESVKLFSSRRDLGRIKDLNTAIVSDTFSNAKNDITAYYIDSGVCIN